MPVPNAIGLTQFQVIAEGLRQPLKSENQNIGFERGEIRVRQLRDSGDIHLVEWDFSARLISSASAKSSEATSTRAAQDGAFMFRRDWTMLPKCGEAYLLCAPSLCSQARSHASVYVGVGMR
jgi:hypothetical protein